MNHTTTDQYRRALTVGLALSLIGELIPCFPTRIEES